MSSLSRSTGPVRFAAAEDLEHFDEPGPDDDEDLDRRTWAHIAALIAEGYPDDDDDEQQLGAAAGDDQADDEQQLGEDPDDDSDPSRRVLPGSPSDVGLESFRLEPEDRPRRSRRPMRERSRPGDAPGWKGAPDA